MTDYAGYRHCPTFWETLQAEANDPDAMSSLNVAAHTISGSYENLQTIDREDQERIREVGLGGLMIRSTAVSLIDAYFKDGEGVYVSLLETVEKDCDGNCETCPIDGADLTPKGVQ